MLNTKATIFTGMGSASHSLNLGIRKSVDAILVVEVSMVAEVSLAVGNPFVVFLTDVASAVLAFVADNQSFVVVAEQV